MIDTCREFVDSIDTLVTLIILHQNSVPDLHEAPSNSHKSLGLQIELKKREMTDFVRRNAAYTGTMLTAKNLIWPLINFAAR